MNYEEFRSEILYGIKAHFGNEVRIECNKVVKDNGIELEGIVCVSGKTDISPCIYLNHLFEEYQQGTSITEFVEEMLKTVNESKGEMKQVLLNSTQKFTDFSQVQDRICFKLVNAEMNKELL